MKTDRTDALAMLTALDRFVAGALPRAQARSPPFTQHHPSLPAPPPPIGGVCREVRHATFEAACASKDVMPEVFGLRGFYTRVLLVMKSIRPRQSALHLHGAVEDGGVGRVRPD